MNEFIISFFAFQSLLKTADQLRIKGLCESSNKDDNPEFEHFDSSNVTRIRKSARPRDEELLDDPTREKLRKLATPKLEQFEEEAASNDGRNDEMPVNSYDTVHDTEQQRRTALNMSSQGLLAGQVSSRV